MSHPSHTSCSTVLPTASSPYTSALQSSPSCQHQWKELEQPTCSAAPQTRNKREQSPTAHSSTAVTQLRHKPFLLPIKALWQPRRTVWSITISLSRTLTMIFYKKHIVLKLGRTCMYEGLKLPQIKMSQKCTCLLKMTKYQWKQREKPLFLFYYFEMDKNEKLSLL